MISSPALNILNKQSVAAKPENAKPQEPFSIEASVFIVLDELDWLRLYS